MERLAADRCDLALHQLVGMVAIHRAADDLHCREMTLCSIDNLQRLGRTIDGHHQQTCLLRTRLFQQAVARSITVKHLVAEAAHQVDLARAAVENRDRHILAGQQAADNLAEASIAGDDDTAEG